MKEGQEDDEDAEGEVSDNNQVIQLCKVVDRIGLQALGALVYNVGLLFRRGKI